MKLKIIGKTYTIQYASVDLMEDKQGDCAPDKCRIWITEDQHPDQEADTRLHEVLHAIWYAMGLPRNNEERIVSQLATGLLAVLKDNGESLPKFMQPEK